MLRPLLLAHRQIALELRSEFFAENGIHFDTKGATCANSFYEYFLTSLPQQSILCQLKRVKISLFIPEYLTIAVARKRDLDLDTAELIPSRDQDEYWLKLLYDLSALGFAMKHLTVEAEYREQMVSCNVKNEMPFSYSVFLGFLKIRSCWYGERS